MGRRLRARVSESPSSRPSLERSIEEYIEDYLWLGRQVDSAFSWEQIGPTGKRRPAYFNLEVLIDLHLRRLDNVHVLHERILHMRNTMDHSKHFPSSPARPPKFVLYFRDPQLAIRSVHGFVTAAGAKGFVDEVMRHLPEEQPKWESDTTILLGSLTIECNKLEDVMEASGIHMPYPYTSWAAGVAGREASRFVAEEMKTVPKREKPAREKRESKPRMKAEGATTAAELAEEFGLAPGKVRSILRDNNIEKPYSWEDGEELDRIRSLIEKGSKK